MSGNLHQRRSLLRLCAWLLLAAAAAIASLECGLRARLWMNDPHVWDDDGLFRYRGNAQVGDSPNLTTNSLGFFGGPVPPGGEDVRLVVLLGSSPLTNPLVPGSMETRLKEMLPEQEWRVMSAGLPRYTSWHNRRLYERVVAPLKPDWVVLYLGMNDNVYNVRPDLAAAPPSGLWDWRRLDKSVLWGMLEYHVLDKRLRARRTFTGTPSAQLLAANAAAVAKHAQENGAGVLIVRMAAAYEPEDAPLREIVQAAAGAMSHYWGDAASSRRGFEANQRALNAVASRLGVPMADASQAIKPLSENFRDLVHFTPEGNRRFGAFLAEALASAAQERQP